MGEIIKISRLLFVLSFLVVSCNQGFHSSVSDPDQNPIEQGEDIIDEDENTDLTNNQEITVNEEIPLISNFFGLPNFLIQGEEGVWIRRIGWNDFIPVRFGTILNTGDLLRASKGSEVSVFCGDKAKWGVNPIKILDDGLDHSIPCQSGSIPRPWEDISVLRGETNNRIPYILYPRNTALLTDKPLLKWQPISGIETYTVLLISDDNQMRPSLQVSGSEANWPSNWPPMEQDSIYVLQVEGGGSNSNTNNPNNNGLGFWLLPIEKLEEVKIIEFYLRSQNLSSSAIERLVAELYLNYGLYGEAAQLLNQILTKANYAAVWLTLGQIYLNMGLVQEAQMTFNQALINARSGGEMEIEAETNVGLGLSAWILNDKDEAIAYYLEAKSIFKQLGHQDGEARVEELLAE
jgi:hypothetical protein